MKIRFFVLFLFTVCVHAQKITPEKLGFQEFHISEDSIGEFSYYLFSKNSKEPKPLLIYLEGSGAFPMFQNTDIGITSTIPFDYNSLSDNFHFLFIGKPGVPFYDKVSLDEYGNPKYNESKNYIEKLSQDWRVDATLLAFNELKSTISISDVYLFGFSEGAQVAPFVAKEIKSISKMILMGGNGLNQFFDPIISARHKALIGQMTEEHAQKEIDSLYKEYDNIYKDPFSTEKKWWGHTYKRWSSFTKVDPVKVLVELNTPIYMANGTLDENSILSADYIQLEFIKHQKTNLTYKAYPNYDHGFNELKFENNELISAESRLDIVINDAFEWLNK